MKPVKPRLHKVLHVWVAASRGHTNGYGDTPEGAAANFDAHRERRSRLALLNYQIQILKQKLDQSERSMADQRRRLESELEASKKKAAARAEQLANLGARLRTADQRARAALEDELAKRESALRAQYQPYRAQYEKLMAERRNATRTRRSTDVRTTAEQL